MSRVSPTIAPVIALVLTACAVPPPTGPSVMALPAKGKTFEEFQRDDTSCRQYASQQIEYRAPGQAAKESAVNSAIVGTAVGAAAGAVVASVITEPRPD